MGGIRIAHVVERLEIGGLERMAVDLAAAQKRAGHTPFLYCVSHGGPLVNAAMAAGVPVRLFDKPPGFSAKAVFRITRQLRADGIQVVHTHNAVIHHYGAAAGLLSRIPTVNTQHGIRGLTIPAQLRNFSRSIPLTAAVVFVSEDTKRLWDERGLPPGKAHVILNGIPTASFAARPARPGAQPGRLRLGTVGRMAPVKDHATLLRAFASIAGRLPGSELHIVGYGPLEEETRALAESLGLGSRFRIHPPDTDVPGFLEELDVFVLSSEVEGLPISVLEAMAAGLPIVSTRVGGIPEAAPEHEVAWYCPPRDPAALATVLEAAAHSSELQLRGRRGADIVTRRFSIDATMQRYIGLFESLLSR